MKKAAAIAVTLILALACSEQHQAPTEVQFAKGGGSGVTLTNYWITADIEGSVLHLEGTGKVDRIAPRPVHDFWHNGTQDDNYSIHFEVFHRGPGGVDVTRDGDTWTVDIPWNGERDADSDFRNFASTADPDPFVFTFPYALTGGRSYCCLDPQGVTIDGTYYGMDYDGLTSYATFTGAAPDGDISVASLNLSEVSCTVTTTGHGKKATTKTVVSGRAQAALASTGLAPHAWMEFHLIVGEDWGEGTSWIGDGADFTIERTLDYYPESVTVRLVLDYVMPLYETIDYDFNPWEPTYTPDVTVSCN